MMMQTPERWRVIEEDVRSYLMLDFRSQFTIARFPTAFISLLSNITADTLITGGIVSQVEMDR